MALDGKGYDNFTGWIGPAGFLAGPFGPNMGVREITPGTTARVAFLPTVTDSVGWSIQFD